jgi:hypothetical protein
MEMVPVLEPFSLPISIAYVLFVWMTWTASALFNLVLRLDSFGRLVLNPSERLESTLVGACLVLGILCGSSALFIDRSLAFIPCRAGLLYLGLMLPLSATFRQPEGRRKWFAAYTVGVTLCVVIATYQSFSFCSLATSPGPQLTVVRIGKVKADDAELVQDAQQKMNAARTAELKALGKSTVQWVNYSIWGIVISTWIGAGSSVLPSRR